MRSQCDWLCIIAVHVMLPMRVCVSAAQDLCSCINSKGKYFSLPLLHTHRAILINMLVGLCACAAFFKLLGPVS